MLVATEDEIKHVTHAFIYKPLSVTFQCDLKMDYETKHPLQWKPSVV